MKRQTNAVCFPSFSFLVPLLLRRFKLSKTLKHTQGQSSSIHSYLMKITALLKQQANVQGKAGVREGKDQSGSIRLIPIFYDWIKDFCLLTMHFFRRSRQRQKLFGIFNLLITLECFSFLCRLLKWKLTFKLGEKKQLDFFFNAKMVPNHWHANKTVRPFIFIKSGSQLI